MMGFLMKEAEPTIVGFWSISRIHRKRVASECRFGTGYLVVIF